MIEPAGADYFDAYTLFTDIKGDAALLLNVNCSAVHIKKCLFNLIVNACESIEDAGNITVSTQNFYLDEPLAGYEDVCMGEYALLTVSDNGSGITADDIERIFEPFYTKKTMGRSGTGLGLTVVWNTVKSHQGCVNVKSWQEGTRFELFFPITRDELTVGRKPRLFEDYCSGTKTDLQCSVVRPLSSVFRLLSSVICHRSSGFWP